MIKDIGDPHTYGLRVTHISIQLYTSLSTSVLKSCEDTRKNPSLNTLSRYQSEITDFPAIKNALRDIGIYPLPVKRVQ